MTSVAKKRRFWCLLIVTSCTVFFVLARFLPLSDNIQIQRTAAVPSTYLFRKMAAQKRDAILNTRTLPNSTYSRISFIDRRQTYKVGEVLIVTITLYDSTGTRIRSGGDMLRLLLKEAKLGANVNGNVTDNGDGTYTGKVLLPWRGESQLVVYLSIPRQLHEIVVNAANEYGTMRHILGIFTRNNTNIRTPCGPIKVIKGFDSLCNLTEMAYNMPWYCVKPKPAEFTCKHWTLSVTASNFTLSPSVTHALLAHQHKVFPKKTFITVKGDRTSMRTSETPCDKRPREQTWDFGTSGFYYNYTWVNIGCRNRYKMTRKQYSKCLAHRHLVLIGDSNVRSYLEFFTRFLKLKITSGNPFDNKPDLVFGHNISQSISAMWRPHGVPYFAAYPYRNEVLVPTSVILDRLKVLRDNRPIVVIHLWSHMLAIPIHIVEERIRDVRKAVERLLSRAPNVTVVIKGPQSHLESQIYLQVDFKRVSFERIWQHEFRYLKNKVIYLNYWDITTGSESKQLHPSQKILSDMVNTFINHVCDV
ncbi:NXPE family member 4-like [Mizuhopecten yessoensis]|uniref:NXPE family member 4 n=1 Tax=Mizuhopecten yessoensis TaxID=6573 RepID=A0A210R0J3_MIZYE|nr:NXPE family member 4-like [Mizuhopecten yessoensis]XP_021345322.1 NXPE family member 4-like [Mizuhopecten yessoensis]OWF54435.1 NXPE family member 4 [Mizuhopecten yessoensis]